MKKNGVTELFSGKRKALHAEFNERAEAATNSYSAAINFLQYTYSVLVTENY